MTECSRKTDLGDMSGPAQRLRLLERLQAGPVDTLTARQELNVMHPAARIQELRELGYNIITHRAPLYDEKGFRHSSCAIYYLSTNREAA
jgi:hypothetical protein